MSTDRLTQIRRAHASAKPVLANPAWRNTHGDLAYALGVIDELTEGLRAAEKHVETLHSIVDGEARAIVYRCLKQMRAAIAKATPA